MLEDIGVKAWVLLDGCTEFEFEEDLLTSDSEMIEITDERALLVSDVVRDEKMLVSPDIVSMMLLEL